MSGKANFPRLAFGRGFKSPGCKAIRIMESEQLQNFNERLSQWVANQGFWFQVRYSMAGSGIKGRAMFHLLRMAFRCLIFLAVIAMGFWVFLVKRPDTARFREALENDMKSGLAASELQLGGFQRVQGQLEIARFAAEGGKGTFFDNLEARNVRCQMGLLDGFAGAWKPGVISISKLDIDFRAGSDDDESSAKIAEVFFHRSAAFDADAIEVSDATVRWGYWGDFSLADKVSGAKSSSTKGSIKGSVMKMQRTESGWRITFRGGQFEQNWLRDLDIVNIEMTCDKQGVRFEKAELRNGDSTVDFSGLRVIAGARPEVKGQVAIRHLPLDAVLPAALETFIEGRISGNFRVFGSVNTADGVGFEGQVLMNSSDDANGTLKDSIALRERIHILKVLSVVDFSRNYNRVDFDEGSFDLKTQNGCMELTNVALKAKDLFTMEGRMLVRPPTEKEKQEAVASGKSIKPSPLFQKEDDAADALDKLRPDSGISLQNAAKQLKREREGSADQEGKNLFERFGLAFQERQLQEEELARQSRVLRYEGMFRISIPGDAFDQAHRLRDLYPVNSANGRIYMQVPIEGNLYELTLKQAEDIYQLRQH